MELKTYFAQDRNGNLIPSANVSIFLTGTTTLATGLTNVSGSALANPFTADANGKIQFRAPDGVYDMQVSLGSDTGARVTFQCVDIEQQLADSNSAADRAEDAADRAEEAAANSGVNTFLVASQAEMLALTAKKGDHAKRSDISKTFILQSTPAATLANWVSIDDDALFQLAKPGGVTKVNGAIVQCATVADAQALTGLTEGQKVRTYFNKTAVVSDWTFTTTQPASPTFYITAAGGYLVLLTPNFASAGITFSDTYNATTAWANRNLMNKLMLDTRFGHVCFGAKGKCWVLGSLTPNRHYYMIEIESGVDLVGRLEDSSIPASVGNNTGAMFDMVLRENYHINGDMTNTGVLYSSDITLNGTVKTVFDASHLQPHNNNCIGYYNAVNCSVVGAGGVEGSDHRGINFDGGCVNGLIDVSYAKGTMDEPLCMHVGTNEYGKVRVGKIYDVPFGGISGLNIGVRCTGGNVDVEIGSFVWDGTTKPVLVSCYNAEEVRLICGYAEGITYALRGYETKRLYLNGGRYKNAAYMAGRAGVNTGRTEEIHIQKVKVLDNTVTTAVYCESNQDTFKKITVRDCDFSLCPSSFLYVRNMLTAGKAAIVSLENNNSPTDAAWVAAYLNYLPGSNTLTLVASGQTSFTYTYKQPDWNYSALSLLVAVSGVTYALEVSLVTRSLGSITFTYAAGAATVTVSISANTITCTVTGGTFTAAYAHN